MSKMMKIALNKLIKGERGQAMPLVLILMLIGGLIIAPLLGHMSTGIKAGQVYEEKMSELYAADAGVEDAIHKIINNYAPLQVLEDNDSCPYSLNGTVNDLSVSVNITKEDIVAGLGEDYTISPSGHGSWIQMSLPLLIDKTPSYIEYSCNVSANFTGSGNRKVESAGVFFTPQPGAEVSIVAPENVNWTGVFASAGSPSTDNKTVPGGFAFIWRWESNKPTFKDEDGKRQGGFTFSFKVYDPDYQVVANLAWFLIQSADVSYVASGEITKWLIEASAGDTTVTSHVFLISAAEFDIITWEINP